MAEVRDVTRNVAIFESWVISVSVIPSEKYSCSGSRDRFSSGKTASDRILEFLLPRSRSRNPPGLTSYNPKTRRTAASPRPTAHTYPEAEAGAVAGADDVEACAAR